MKQTIKESDHAGNKSGASNPFKSLYVSEAISGGMNNNGWRPFRRNGTVPQAVFATLRQSGIIKQDAWIFEGGATIGELLEFLKCYPYESEQARFTGDYIFRQIFNTDIPSLNRIFAQGRNA
jgi:hypothetical protein